MAGFRITTIHAWVAIDPDDGDEGICAATTRDGILMPLIAADEERIRSCEDMARRIARSKGVVVKLVRFSVREDLQTIEPPSRGRD